MKGQLGGRWTWNSLEDTVKGQKRTLEPFPSLTKSRCKYRHPWLRGWRKNQVSLREEDRESRRWGSNFLTFWDTGVMTITHYCISRNKYNDQLSKKWLNLWVTLAKRKGFLTVFLSKDCLKYGELCGTLGKEKEKALNGLSVLLQNCASTLLIRLTEFNILVFMTQMWIVHEIYTATYTLHRYFLNILIVMQSWKIQLSLGYKISQRSTRILTFGEKKSNKCDHFLIKNIIN